MIDFLGKRKLIEDAIKELGKAEHYAKSRWADCRDAQKHIREMERARAMLENSLRVGYLGSGPSAVV